MEDLLGDELRRGSDSRAASGDADEAVGYRDVRQTSGRAVRSGLAWTMAGQWVGYLVQIVTTAILARLLTPKDFGILGEALTVTALAAQLQTLGLSQAVIQRAKLTHGQMSNLFWLNAAGGALFAIIVAAISPLVAKFYSEPALVGITIALAGSYLIAGLGVQHSALMARRMQFRAMALRSLLPRVIAGAVGIIAALYGARYWALVAQQIVLVVFTVILVWTAIEWRPGKPRRRTGVRPLLSFGAGVSVANLLYYFSSNADNILVGRFLGAAPLGLYARAYNLFLVPLRQLHGPLGNVVQPVLAALADQPAKYRRFYRRTLASIAIVGMPGVVFLAVMSYPIIVTILGAQWVGAVGPFRWLAVAGFLQMVSRTYTWLFTTWGRARAMATWASVASPAIVVSFVIGLHWGITGVAASYAIVQSILTVPGIWYSVRGTPVTMTDVWAAVWRPGVVSAAVGLVAWICLALLDGQAPITRLVVGTVVATACWACLVALWPAVRDELKALRGTVRPAPDGATATDAASGIPR